MRRTLLILAATLMTFSPASVVVAQMFSGSSRPKPFIQPDTGIVTPGRDLTAKAAPADIKMGPTTKAAQPKLVYCDPSSFDLAPGGVMHLQACKTVVEVSL